MKKVTYVLANRAMGHIGWVDFTGGLFFGVQSRSKSFGNLRSINRFSKTRFFVFFVKKYLHEPANQMIKIAEI